MKEPIEQGKPCHCGQPYHGLLNGSQNEMPATLIGALELDLVTGHVKLAGQPVPLTNLEFRVLSHMVTHAGRVVSASELLQAGWKCEPGTSGTADQVRSCIKCLRQ